MLLLEDLLKVRRMHKEPLGTLEGEVVRGQRLGGSLGFPTANIEAQDSPYENGVYLVDVSGLGGVERGVANLGTRPTVGLSGRLLEVHMFDYQGGDLYGKRLRVQLRAKLRDEIKFESVDALKEQVHRDIAMARSVDAT